MMDTQQIENLKIVFVSRFPKDIDSPRGGVETATVGLARAIQGIGVKHVHVVSLERDIASVVKETHENINVHRLGRSAWPMMIDVFCGPSTRTLRNYLNILEPSIVHFHETWGFGAPNCGWPNVFTVHGFDSLNLPTEKQPVWRLRSQLWKIAERFGLGHQKTIISIAPYVTRTISKLTSARIFEIWNSLDRSYFELKRNENVNEVIFLGWLNQRKNPLALIEATARLKDKYPQLIVSICGEPSDKTYAELLSKRIGELDLRSQVILTGRLSQSEVKKKVASASMLVLPSYQENAPMVVAEAMAAGIPVIASNLCGMPDMLEHNRSGILLDPEDYVGIAEAMDSLLSDPKKRAAMGQAAREEAFRRYHPDSVAKATCKVYMDVIHGNP